LPIIVPAKAILTYTGLQHANGFAFSIAIKGNGFANSSEHQHIHQFGGIKRRRGKHAYQCADTSGAVLAKRAVFAKHNVFLQRGRYFVIGK
jgi:hypothetical protein